MKYRCFSLLVPISVLVMLAGCASSTADNAQEPPSGSAAGGENSTGDTCMGFHASDNCMSDSAFAMCEQAEAQCPGEVQVAESCPAQFFCPGSDEGGSPDATQDVSAEQCAGHTVDETCMNPQNFAQCQEMERRCPGHVIQMESCPLQFGCEQ